MRSQISDVRYQIPVSVKTRIGSSKPDKSWWEFLASQELPAVAMHGRTFKQLYSGEADWEVLLTAGEIIMESGAKFLGNGDIGRVLGAKLLVPGAGNEKWGVVVKTGEGVDLTGEMDGVLIGREAIGNPWMLRKDGYIPTIEEKLLVAVEHAYKFEEMFKFAKQNKELIGWIPGQARNDFGNFQFFPMRKHLAGYIRGFEGSTGLRKSLMTAEGSEQVEEIIKNFLSSH